MTKSYFRMVPTTCRRANARGRYRLGTNMTKSYFRMVPTTCRLAQARGRYELEEVVWRKRY